MCHNGAMDVKTYTTVKINLSTDLKRLAEKEAGRIGFSLQDFMRMMLGSHFAKPVLPTKLSLEEELYLRALPDIESGRCKSFKSGKELVEYLHTLC